MALRDNIGNADIGTGSQVVIGLFNNGNDAQQAIGELREEGFRTNQIGAAFRETAISSLAHGSWDGNPTDHPMAVGRSLTENAYSGSDSRDSGSLGGPASGSNAVTPAGLGSGSGMSLTGAGRPGPIPGSEIPHHRTRDEHDARTTTPRAFRAPGTGRAMDIGPAGFDSVSPDVTTSPQSTAINHFGTERGPEMHPTQEAEGWWDKLKRVFTEDDATAAESHHAPDAAFGRSAGERKFGTGEGDLGLTSNPAADFHANDVREAYDFAYSPAEFEASLAVLGLDQQHARAFSRQLGTHGAIVTVAAGSKAPEAENILQRNNGSIRHEEDSDYGNRTADDELLTGSSPQTPTRSQVSAGEGAGDRIQLFGEVRRAYGQRTPSTRNDEKSDSRDDLRRPA